jgi:SET domain
LMLNYCYSHRDSNVLLLPIGLGVNAINHSPTPNAYLRWKTSAFGSSQSLLRETPHEILAVSASMEVGPDSDQLWIEIVAMKQINAGDEVFLDYGADWQRAWEQHEKTWSSQLEPEELSYVSAATYLNDHPNDPIPTQGEQSAATFPDNLRTACIFRSSEDAYDAEAPPTVEYTANLHSSPFCLRPCDILERIPSSDNESSAAWLYTAQVYNRPSITDSGHPCGLLPAGGLRVSNMPSAAVTIVDKPYTNDALMRQAFRHEIGVPPEGFWPANWMKKDPKSLGDFIPTPLGPGEMQIIRWADTGEIVVANAYRLGLRPRFSQVMLEYCEKMGIVDLFRHLTYKGNALDVGKEAFLTLDGEEWYLQRPGSKWNSNLQWLSPGGNPAHDHYLQALSVAGFDEMLRGIGENLQLESLVVFHVTFIAVSHSVSGYMHYDVTETQNKTFNVIVPLILANKTGPELDLQSNKKDPEGGENPVGRYRYEMNVASMMGDDAMHASSATDYRTNKEMRLAATIYLAEVTEENADYIMQQYTQAFPPQERDLLLSWAGRHWKRDDPTKKLPDPAPHHILVKDLLAASAR